MSKKNLPKDRLGIDINYLILTSHGRKIFLHE